MSFHIRCNRKLFAIRVMSTSAIVLDLALASYAQLAPPLWTQSQFMGSSLSAGPQGFIVDSAGNSYVTGISGDSNNTDILTIAYGPDGSQLWSKVYNGPGNWHDQARGMTLSPDESVLWVCGNTPDANKSAEALLLKYDAVTGSLLGSTIVSAVYSEHFASVATDAQGNVYATGGTVGDGSDVMTMKFDSNGVQKWRMAWDGDAFGPYSQDHGQKILVGPDGDPVIQVHGVMADLQPDYVAIKYDTATGDEIWVANWGTRGGEYVVDTVLDDAGDVYQTGTGIDFTNKFSTVKYDGDTGAIIWQKYDFHEIDDHASTLALDGQGGVYITGTVDPDGDQSNFNDNMYTVKRATSNGAFLWDHVYGENCIRCFDAPSDIVIDAAGNVILAGSTSSPPYDNGYTILFLLDQASGAEVDRLVLIPGDPMYTGAGTIRFDADYDFYMGSRTYNANTGDVGSRVAKFASLAGDLPYQLGVSNLVAGANAVFTVEHATPGRTQYIAYSLRGLGSTPVPPLNVVLDLRQPKLLANGVANGSGSFETRKHIPAGASGMNVWFQCAESNRTTVALSEVVQ